MSQCLSFLTESSVVLKTLLALMNCRHTLIKQNTVSTDYCRLFILIIRKDERFEKESRLLMFNLLLFFCSVCKAAQHTPPSRVRDLFVLYIKSVEMMKSTHAYLGINWDRGCHRATF